VNRVPAKTIWEALSEAPIANSSYPSLIQGKALPQRKQQIRAQINTTPVLFICVCEEEEFIGFRLLYYYSRGQQAKYPCWQDI